MKSLALAALLLASARAGHAEGPRVLELPEDIGPAAIDVSSYPPEQKKVYEEVFLPVYSFLRGGPARAINSPLIEIDAAGEEALRKARPEFFADEQLAQVTRDGWKKEVYKVKNRPPCCGACPVLTQESARALWRFLVYDSLRRKTGDAAAEWLEHRRRLIVSFEKERAKPGR